MILLAAFAAASFKAYAVDCSGVPVSGNYTVSSTCTFANSPVDGIVDSCPTNTAVLTIDSTGSLSILNGQTIVVGSVSLTQSGGSITIVDGGTLQLNTALYIADSDSDGYPDYGASQSTSTGTCRTSMTSMTQTDCGPDSANAYPGATTYRSTSFTNTATGLSYDWNCDGTETKQYPTATYSCYACTNGSGYASTRNTVAGFVSSTPACGASGTWRAITNSTCRDPAVSLCTGSYSTSTVTQTCL